MAVLPGIPGLTVQVKVAGEAATEYDGQAPECRQSESNGARTAEAPATGCCYIEAVTGQEYTVEATIIPDLMKLKAHDKFVRLEVEIDGTYADSEIVSTKKHHGQSGGTLTLHIVGARSTAINSGQRVRMKQPLMFAPISKVDDASHAAITHDVESAQHLGKITAKVFLARRRERTKAASTGHVGARVDNGFQLAEKSVKGRELSHGTSFGQAFPSTGRQWKARGKRVIAVFDFFYQSRDALQKMMILPRSRNPSLPANNEADDNNDRKQRLRQELRRAKEQIETLAGLLNDMERAPAEAGPRVKREREEAEQTRKRIKSEVVDLTSD